MDRWRMLDARQRARIAREYFEKMLERYAEGAIEHGETFTSDPLDELEKELMDSLFYLSMARRERDARVPTG